MCQQRNDCFSRMDSFERLVFFDLVKKLPTLVSTMYNYSTRFKIFTVMLLCIQDFLDSSQCLLVSRSRYGCFEKSLCLHLQGPAV